MSTFTINSFDQYKESYNCSVENPHQFWDEIAQHYTWFKPYTEVSRFSMEDAQFSWFNGGETNITFNCLDRHLPQLATKTALLFEPNDPSEPHQEITYVELHHRVCELANVLLKKGIRKGDRVCIYLPMIPELAISLLACARIGAIHSVVFAGFSAGALASRIDDCSCKMVITSDGGYRGNKTIDLKAIVDEALIHCSTVETVLVVERTKEQINMIEGRDFWLKSELLGVLTDCRAEPMQSEDPLFILYTSGSTGKPKGMMHSTGGYMVYVGYTFQNVFQYQPSDVFWCTADIGWITGHSYVVYGPLINGATQLMYEGTPDTPSKGRLFELIEKYKVSILYTAPTLIRTWMKWGDEYPNKSNLSSLRLLGSVGEPINPEAWMWYREVIGKNNCPIVDTWWQTETGAIMISPLPGVTATKPGSAMKALPGISAEVVDDVGKAVGNGRGGYLVLTKPWPSMMRGVWNEPIRYKETYWSRFTGVYFAGDGAKLDKDGAIWLLGRVDDVMNVSGHRISTTEVESALVSHDVVAEAAVVGAKDEMTGQGIVAFVILRGGIESATGDALVKELRDHVAKQIGPIAKPRQIMVVAELPKTRSGKIMRRLLRDVAENRAVGDSTTLADPNVMKLISEGLKTGKSED